MAADRTPNELADAIADFLATEPDDPQSVDDHAVDLLERSLVSLRRQGEQLDTLRAAIGDPDELRGHELDMSDGTVNTPEVTHEIVRDILLRIAAAVEHTQEGT